MTMEMEHQVKEIEGMYLSRDLQGMAKKAGRMIVIANYVTDLNDVIARKDESGEFQVARELKNDSDWRLFQELTAQADVIITGAGYLKRFAKLGAGAENVVDQFSKGGQFEELGDWRESHGFKNKRNPDIAIVSRSLDFEIPKGVFEKDRRVIVFTTYAGASNSNPKSKEFKKAQATVIGAGVDGVDGGKMIEFMREKMGHKVVKMTTGPRVLKILLDANVLDELYITQVQREIKADPSEVQTVLANGKVEDLQGFELTGSRIQNGVTTADGERVSQKFLIYGNREFLKLLKR